MGLQNNMAVFADAPNIDGVPLVKADFPGIMYFNWKRCAGFMNTVWPLKFFL